jgi:hypothetical protein
MDDFSKQDDEHSGSVTCQVFKQDMHISVLDKVFSQITYNLEQYRKLDFLDGGV